jgi:hypothetical protein
MCEGFSEQRNFQSIERLTKEFLNKLFQKFIISIFLGGLIMKKISVRLLSVGFPFVRNSAPFLISSHYG